MADTSHALHMQAVHALNRSSELRRSLSVAANSSFDPQTQTVKVDIDLVRSLISYLGTSAGLIQKQNRSIEEKDRLLTELL